MGGGLELYEAMLDDSLWLFQLQMVEESSDGMGAVHVEGTTTVCCVHGLFMVPGAGDPSSGSSSRVLLVCYFGECVHTQKNQPL